MIDSNTKAGANSLAKQIREYWSKRGFHVSVWVEEVEYERTLGNIRTMFSVKSDLLNGLPRAAKAALAA